jgi:hypothetical protein
MKNSYIQRRNEALLFHHPDKEGPLTEPPAQAPPQENITPEKALLGVNISFTQPMEYNTDEVNSNRDEEHDNYDAYDSKVDDNNEDANLDNNPPDSPLKQSDLEYSSKPQNLVPNNSIGMEETKRGEGGRQGEDMAKTEKMIIATAVIPRPKMIDFGMQKGVFEEVAAEKWKMKVRRSNMVGGGC